MPRQRKQRGEPVSEYLTRLTAGDPLRIRVHPDYIDSEGNVIVKPMLICGQDTSDDYRPARMDTSGRLDTIGHVPEHQTDATIIQSNPGDGTQYEILAATDYVRLISAAIRCTWAVQPTPLELFTIVDGQTITWSKANPVTNTWYFPRVDASSNPDTQELTNLAADQRNRPFVLEGRNMQILGEVSGGTVSQLRAVVKYALW